ncbi:MAG: methyltransferase domain-containing protein [Thermoplasmata archaeon]|nr:MAG: methyltransferase domain-containing protein [Thermoplasmata archaeon]
MTSSSESVAPRDDSLIFELSGEHECLPRAEVLACLEALEIEYDIENEDAGILVIQAEGADIDDLGKRLALTRFIDLNYHSCEPEELESLDWAFDIGEGTFAVRARRIQGQHEGLNLKELEKRIADRVKGNNTVDLENPDIEVRVIVSQRCFIGLKKKTIPRSAFEERKVQNRPYFSPVSLHPRLARALVNLSRVRRGQVLLDPFCGTGGILIEAAMVGADVVGSDIDKRMVGGCRENLESLGIENARLLQADISELKNSIDDVDAIATDPPYGRAATTNREELASLYRRAFETCEAVLGREGYMAVVLPSTESISLGEEHLSLRESYTLKVHRSLTRHFCVYQKT